MTLIKMIKEITAGEILEGKVTPSGSSGHVSISKKYIGKNIKIVVPENPTMFLLIEQKDINYLLKNINKVDFGTRYEEHRKKAVLNALEIIKNQSTAFPERCLIDVYSAIEYTKDIETKIIQAKIKKAYKW